MPFPCVSVIKVSKLEKAKKNLISEDTVTLQEFNEKLQELHSVRAELERVRKDKNIISGLVNQTQRDMSSKVWLSVSFLFWQLGAYLRVPTTLIVGR